MCPEAEDFREMNAFSNDLVFIRRTYDFDKDGGAISVIDLLKAKDAMVLEQAYVSIKTGVESPGAVTVEVGIKGGDTDAILPATVKANLLANTTIDGASASKRLRIAKDAIIALEIKVDTITAGKIEVVLAMRKF